MDVTETVEKWRSFLLWGRFLTQNLARANPNLFTLDSFNFRVWTNICFVLSKSYTEEKSKGCALRTITKTQYFYFVEIYLNMLNNAANLTECHFLKTLDTKHLQK